MSSIQPSTTTSFINEKISQRNFAAIQPMLPTASVQHQFAMPTPHVSVSPQQYSPSSLDDTGGQPIKTFHNNVNQYSTFIEQDNIYGTRTLNGNGQNFRRSNHYDVQHQPPQQLLTQSIYSENPNVAYQQRPLSRSHSTASANHPNHATHSNGGTFNFRNSQNSMNSSIYEAAMGSRSSSRSVDVEYVQTMGPKSKSSHKNGDSKIIPELNVAEMILHGIADSEILKTWLASIDCVEYSKNFIEHGYDMPTITRMTPQDLTAIGCTVPALRRKLQVEIRKLNLNDGIPDHRPNTLENWLELLRLDIYYDQLCDQGYNSIDKVCELTWEDLEEIGIKKLGHQKRLLLGIDRIKELDKQSEQSKNDHAIYDVHPNHRMTLIPDIRCNDIYGMLHPINQQKQQQRSPRSSATDNGTPIATVMPAMKDGSSSPSPRNSIYRMSDPTAPHVMQSMPLGQVGYQDGGSMMKNYNHSISAALLGKGRRVQPPVPPMRTNSLRISSSPYLKHTNNNDSIYGNHASIMNEEATRPHVIQMPSSFSRVPRLGTLTSTTNKMLANGGHLQMNGHVPLSIHPIREVPLPPTAPVLPPIDKINEEPIQNTNKFDPPSSRQSSSALPSTTPVPSRNVMRIDFEEFPPPPSPIPAEVYHDSRNEVEVANDMARLSTSISS